MKTLISATAILAIPFAVHAQASFDCRQASTQVEHAICADGTLSQLDRQMAEAYSAARSTASGSNRDRMLAEQRSWLTQRSDCGPDAACLAESMQDRIAALGDRTNEALSGLTGLYCTDNAVMGLEDSGASLRFDFMFFAGGGHSCGTPTLAAERVGAGWISRQDGCELRLSLEGGDMVIRASTPDTCKDSYCGARAMIGEFRMPLSARKPWATDPFTGGVGERPC